MLAVALHLPLLLVLEAPTFNGSVGARATVTAPSGDALLSTRDQALAQLLLDANLQSKAPLFDDSLVLTLDASAFVPLQTGFVDANLDGALEGVDDHDTGARPFLVFSEGYASWEPMDHLVLTFGKKRVVWGPGMIFNPTDVLNPPRDPTDPASQRAGVLLAKVDVPFELFTVTGVFAPALLEETAGIPSAAFSWDATRLGEDDDRHWAAALRGYALVFDTDVNAWVVVSNLYNGDAGEDFENHARLMLTVSRNIFTIHEVHAEVVLEQGSTRRFANDDCVDDNRAFLTCLFTRTELLEQPLLTSDRILPRILVGWRPMLDDGSMFSVEYYYQADGMSADEHAAMKDTLRRVGALQRQGLLPATLDAALGSGRSTSALPNRASFSPVRRHYVLATAQKPQVLDDFTLSGTLIVGAEDVSGLASASVLWSAAEWLNLSLIGIAPIPSLLDPGNGEFDGAPFNARVLFEARAFF